MSCARGCCVTQGEHYRSLTFGGTSAQARAADRFEAALDKDRPAYKRLRDQGLQPRSVKGAAEIEARASSKFEVESGRVLPPKVAKRVDSAVIEAAQVTQAAS